MRNINDNRAQPIDLPNDDRVQHRYVVLNGSRYHYLYSEPKSGSYQYTVFLVVLSPPLGFRQF